MRVAAKLGAAADVAQRAVLALVFEAFLAVAETGAELGELAVAAPLAR